MTDSTHVAQFFAFMKARHDIYVARNKDRKPYPWTADPILQQFRFCNVYRELDTVTIWIRQHIREPFADHPHLWFMLAMARRINLPDTLAEIIADKKGAWPHGKTRSAYRPDRLLMLLDDRTARGEQVYTGAYMITAETGPEHTGQTKSRTTAYSNLLPLWEAAPEIEPQLHHSLKEAFGAILGRGFAWGPFMTYEVVTDLRHTRYLREAPDVNTWANAGPGAFRGLNRVFGRPLKQAQNPQAACQEMADLLTMSKHYWPKPTIWWPKLEMRDIEHSLCEFDKYERVRNGEGRPRSMYHPALK
jgi:hypothetical protein